MAFVNKDDLIKYINGLTLINNKIDLNEINKLALTKSNECKYCEEHNSACFVNFYIHHYGLIKKPFNDNDRKLLHSKIDEFNLYNKKINDIPSYDDIYDFLIEDYFGKMEKNELECTYCEENKEFCFIDYFIDEYEKKKCLTDDDRKLLHSKIDEFVTCNKEDNYIPSYDEIYYIIENETKNNNENEKKINDINKCTYCKNNNYSCFINYFINDEKNKIMTDNHRKLLHSKINEFINIEKEENNSIPSFDETYYLINKEIKKNNTCTYCENNNKFCFLEYFTIYSEDDNKKLKSLNNDDRKLLHSVIDELNKYGPTYDDIQDAIQEWLKNILN
jgi:Fe-S cluster biosynthesis and repair protein YggX